VLDSAFEQPAYGQLCVSNELRKRGVFVSPGGVRSIWLRHDLATFKGRLKALEARMALEGIVLTESQLAAMERVREEADGETETEHLGAQDTYYVGFLGTTNLTDRIGCVSFLECQIKSWLSHLGGSQTTALSSSRIQAPGSAGGL